MFGQMSRGSRPLNSAASDDSHLTTAALPTRAARPKIARMPHDLLYLVVAILAFGFGFATQRGSVCGVLAARQIVETGRASRLVAFVTASLWALVVIVPLAWLAPGRFILGSFTLGTSQVGAALALAGGALYGLGTIINGACVFGTASRVLSGNVSFAMALPGIAIGAGLAGTLGLPLWHANPTASPLHEPSLAAFVLLLVAAIAVMTALINIVRSYHRAGLGFSPALRAARWRTSMAMMIIGILGGALFAGGGPWSYPTFLRQAGNIAFGRPGSFDVVTIVGPLALVAGGVFSALTGGRFAWRPVSVPQIGRSLVGGVIMGIAATIIPGGNDVLLLSGLPSLSLHAALAYPAMVVTQIALLVAAKQWKVRSSQRPSTSPPSSG